MASIKRVVFLGDSITMGYGLDQAGDRFPTVFCERIGAKELNYGITGTLMARAGFSKSDGSSFLDRYGSMEAADLAVVFGSTNDYFWSDMPIASDTSEDDGYFSNAVRHLCLGMKEKYPGIPIVFIMPYQMRGIGNFLGGKDARTSSTHNTDQRNYVGCSLADYVRVQSQICRENRICVLDLFHNFKADIAHSDEDEARYTLDGCHPNASGHRMIADALQEFLKGMI